MSDKRESKGAERRPRKDAVGLAGVEASMRRVVADQEDDEF